MRCPATTLASAIMLLGTAVLPEPAFAQSPTDGRIVRVVYAIVFDGRGPTGSTWGFHLAHMKDGRTCVRLGNPGRLTLAIIEKVADICFAAIPGAVERSQERTSRAFDTSNKPVTLNTYQKGSIERVGDDITLTITSCTQVQGDADTRCFPNRYVVHMKGADCGAEIALARGKAAATTCEHYEAR